ncbi:MAG: septum formation protein Maf [Betaproteobacteria bacterium]|nr:septum formation protein Maf [Betaproteobacteria bacterium]MDE2622220.1 septum formation protein Maf [Betaproteobacteria bacterium]
MSANPQPPLILASSSPYRKELLSRLRLPFDCVSPHLDESPLPAESPETTCERLARAKAEHVARQHPGALVIGSDQVAVLRGRLLGKPGNHENALHQLREASGQEAVFHTAVCLFNPASGRSQLERVPVTVRYRTFGEGEIARYLAADRPYDCAGSGRIETLGITLVEWVHSDDPTALIGLPLIALSRMLRAEGFLLP